MGQDGRKAVSGIWGRCLDQGSNAAQSEKCTGWRCVCEVESPALVIGTMEGIRENPGINEKIVISMLLSGCRVVLARAGTGPHGNRRIFGTFYLFGCSFLKNISLR